MIKIILAFPFMAHGLLLDLLMLEAEINAEENAASEWNDNRRDIRRRQLALDIPDRRFIEHYRINKDMFFEILSLIEDDIQNPTRSSAYPKVTQLLVVLRWLAIGDYQRPTGDSTLLGVSQSGISRIISNILPLLERKFCPLFIKWPSSTQEIQRIKQGFLTDFGIPSTLGVIDGTQIEICAPDFEHLYLNRHGEHSMNVSLICDHTQKFIAVDATHPGGTHDASIWSLSEERVFMENLYRQERVWLLGDSGYPLEPWLITPFKGVRTIIEREFNQKFSEIRCIIENSIGVLKKRWRILLTSERVLCYDPCKTISIVNVCVALHNMCKDRNIPDEEIDDSDDSEDEDDSSSPEQYSDSRDSVLQVGRQNRLLLQEYLLE